MGSAGAAERSVSLALGDPGRVKVSVALVPYLSVLAGTVDAVGGMHRGIPPRWRDQLSSKVTAAGHAAVQPVTDPTVGIVPDSLLPHLRYRPTDDVELGESLQQIDDAEPEQVRQDLFAEFGGVPPAAWLPAVDHPKLWMQAWADVIAAVGEPMTVLWNRASVLMEREIQRVGVATSRGATSLLLGRLHSRITCTGGDLIVSHVSPGRYDLAGRELVLVPMIAGDRMWITHFDLPDHVVIGYPVPGLGPLWERPDPDDPPAKNPDSLSALMGSLRARILLALDGPMTMGQLTDRMGTAPATITSAVFHLQEAGLVDRVRRGRTVGVARSEIGDRLLGLYVNRDQS